MTTTTAWAHLPNARHIDAVLADMRARPEVWAAAWGTAHTGRPPDNLRHARAAVSGSGRTNISLDVRHRLGAVVTKEAWLAAYDAMTALVIWDSAADLLDLPADTLRAMIDLAPAPVCYQALLLLPWVIIKNH